MRTFPELGVIAQGDAEQRLNIVLIVFGIIAGVFVLAFIWDTITETRAWGSFRKGTHRAGIVAMPVGLVVAVIAFIIDGPGEDNDLLFTGLGTAVAGLVLYIMTD